MRKKKKKKAFESICEGLNFIGLLGYTLEKTKWVARPQTSISAPSNLAPVRPRYSPTKVERYWGLAIKL